MIYIVDIEDESEIKFSDCTNLPKWRSTLIVWAVLSEYINPPPPPPPPPPRKSSFAPHANPWKLNVDIFCFP